MNEEKKKEKGKENTKYEWNSSERIETFYLNRIARTR